MSPHSLSDNLKARDASASKKGGGGGQAKKNVSFRGAGGGGGGKGPSELKYVSFYFFILYFPLRGGKKYGFFLFRKNSERGGGLVQSKISLSEKNEIFLDFFLFKMDLGKRDMVNRG